jgi:AcrR family transcriptional regulator
MARTPKVVEDRREQIIEAAMRIFAQKGFIRATNKDIAREAGITPGLIYHYFENKEALFKAIVEKYSPLQVMRAVTPQMLALPPETFLSFLLRQILSVVEGEHFVQLIRAFLPEVIYNPEMSPLALSILGEAIDFLSHYLSSKIESGEVRQVDALLTAQTLLGCLIGFVLRRQVLRDPTALAYTQEQIVESVVTSILEGLRPR